MKKTSSKKDEGNNNKNNKVFELKDGKLDKKSKKIIIFKMIKVFEEENIDPEIELDYKNPFMLLVAVLLSAQSTDKQVNIVTKKLFANIETPNDMLKLGEKKLKEYIKSIGFFNNKAKNIIKTSSILDQRFDGKIPDNREQLMSLPGIGRKSANVILNVIFNCNTLGVDTHIFRVANRLKLSNGKTPDEVEDDLMKVIPKDVIGKMHQWIVLHGRYICKARKPECRICPVKNFCLYEDKVF